MEVGSGNDRQPPPSLRHLLILAVVLVILVITCTIGTVMIVRDLTQGG